MAKEYIKLWSSYESYFEPLGAAEVGRLVLAMMKYKSSGVEPEFSGSEKFIWPAIKRDLDEDVEYTQKQSDLGKKGGRPKKGSERVEKGAKGSERVEKPDEGRRTEDKEILPSGNTKKAAAASLSPDLAEVVACWERYIGVPPRSAGEKLSILLNRMDVDMIRYGIRLMAQRHGNSVEYLERILGDWEREGCHTLADVDRLEDRRRAQAKDRPVNTCKLPML